MGIQIEGGTGNGYAVGVTDENRLKVSAVIHNSEHETNHHSGQAYSSGVSVSPNAGASVATCILYIKNNSDLDMIITEQMFTVTTTNVNVSMKLDATGTPSNTAALTPTNRNAGSGNIADVTAYIGADGSGIGGLSGGNTVMTVTVIAGQPSAYYENKSGFIIPKNKTFTIWASGNCTGLRVGTGLTFHILGE